MKRKRFKKLMGGIVPHLPEDQRGDILRKTRELPTLRGFGMSYAELWAAMPGEIWRVGVKQGRNGGGK